MDWVTVLRGAGRESICRRRREESGIRQFSIFNAAIRLIFALLSVGPLVCAQTSFSPPEIRTPKASPLPRINGPVVFGVRPGHPLLYHIPATGERPIVYSASQLPDGLALDPQTGQLTGSLAKPGDYVVLLRAKNSRGAAEKPFNIIVGEAIGLTPPMGWNSWNCWGSRVDADKVVRSARAMAISGLIDHGWTYINIDDAWQGKRGGKYNGLQGNEKFPDMRKLCDEIHALGLKIGIYSTPWVTSYANHPGGSAENPGGAWSKPTIEKRGHVNKKILPWAIGKYSFATNDARQWADWGIDYLKYDWNPNEEPETAEMYRALRSSGRDVIFSLSNSTPFTNAPVLSKIANCWRTTGDIRDTWDSMSRKGFGEDKWAPFCRPGHWNDPDMLVVGYVGWSAKVRPTRLTPNEQYTHISLWCLLCSPLLIGCDMTRLDEFTLGLLTNDEVLDVNQDPLGRQAARIAKNGSIEIWAKDIEGGSKAVGIFNRGEDASPATLKLSDLDISGRASIRDLWRQQDLGKFNNEFQTTVPRHGVVLVKVTGR